MDFCTPYGQYDPMDFATGPGEEPSMTRQAFADECDVNNIVARAERTGVISHYNQAEPRFMDVSEMVDFQTAMNTVIATQEAFDSLPAAVRQRFANDPAELVAFVANDANRDEAIKLGLVEPKENSSKLGLVEPKENSSSKAPAAPVKEVSESAVA